jgi:hypothetical protein
MYWTRKKTPKRYPLQHNPCSITQKSYLHTFLREIVSDTIALDWHSDGDLSILLLWVHVYNIIFLSG